MYSVFVRVNGTPSPHSIRIAPRHLSLREGGAGTFSATLQDQFRQSLDAPVAWKVSGGGTIDAKGRFTSNGTSGFYAVIAAPVDYPAVTDTATVSVGYEQGLAYEYFEASISSVDFISNLDVANKGTSANFDLSVARRGENFALRFTGLIDVPVKGDYTFSTSSDDGSALFIDGKLVVSNDGTHGVEERSGKETLTTGMHNITVLYFQGGGGKSLAVSYTPPGSSRSTIPDSMLFRSKTDQTSRVPYFRSPRSRENTQPCAILDHTGNSIYVHVTLPPSRHRVGATHHVGVSLYDSRGRCVRHLRRTISRDGTSTLRLDGSDGHGNHLSAGMYLCRWTIDGRAGNMLVPVY